MGVRNTGKEILERLSSKGLDARFVREIREGLNCSPFEAEAVLEVVREVYGPYLGGEGQPFPGCVSLVVVGAEEPAGKPISSCAKVTVCLQVHRGQQDDQLLHREGAAGFRQVRIPDLCQEALSHGGLLTREDLAYRVFFVSVRTIGRDLSVVRARDPGLVIPLRSQMQDIGPALTHRTEIVRLALEGKTTSQICEIVRHSPSAVANYLSTFVRCVQLERKGVQAGQIAYLLRRGRSLVRQYLALAQECSGDANREYHLGELLRVGTALGGEKGQGGSGG